MSGIFGVLDPSGPDLSALKAAAEEADYRGTPEVVADGPWALGAYRREHDENPFARGRHSVLVADARIDALLQGRAALPARSSAELLESAVSDHGPNGLAAFAGDFALAHFDLNAETLTLSRDALGLRPLFWARSGAAVGFASEPAVLEALGLVTGELDSEIISAHLAQRSVAGERTEFLGVSRVCGGRWVSFSLRGSRSKGRWFRPEEVEAEDLSLDEFAEEINDALVDAVVSRQRDRHIALLLSGGRDSGSVAVALARSGVRATCITHTFDPELGCSEAEEARSLALGLGHRWIGVPIPETVSPGHLRQVCRTMRTPLAPPSVAELLLPRDAVAGAGAGVVLDGEGGDVLFRAPPVVLLDLIKRSQFGLAISLLRSSHRTSGVGSFAWAALRGLLPAPLPPAVRRLRARRRRPPPWVIDTGSASRERPPTDSRESIDRLLLEWGADPYPEYLERLFSTRGITYASPLFDQRVIRLGLALPPSLRVPVPSPKPLLSRAFLNGYSETRRKADFTPYYERLATRLRNDFPELIGVDGGLTLAHQMGLIRQEEIDPDGKRWKTALLRVMVLEAWLRNGSEGR